MYEETLTELPSIGTSIHLGSDGLPDGGEAIGTIYSLSRDLTNNSGQTVETDDYSNLDGIAYSAGSPRLGTQSFARTDLTTQGNWTSVYGAQGDVVAGDSAPLSWPSYLQAHVPTMPSTASFSGTTDVRLPYLTNSSSRSLSYWTSGVGAGASFTIDLNPTDTATHQVALYMADWNSAGRSQRVDLMDAAGTTVLDTANVSGFAQGQYVTFSFSGHVKLKFTNTGSSTLDAILNGIFFDHAGNYYTTTNWFDAAGNLSRTQDANGTITRTIFDALDRPTAVYVGTSDVTGNGSWWSPTNQGSANLLDVEDDGYDQRQGAPATSGVSLNQTPGGTIAATTYYIKVTLVSDSGESLASTEMTKSVSASNLLTVSIPTAIAGAAGFNVYVSTTSGGETMQNNVYVPFGSTGWTEPATGLVTGLAVPIDQAGDSNLTQVTRHPGGGAADRVTNYLYDWRDRVIAEKDGVQASEDTTTHRPIFYATYDNLDEITGVYQYDGDGVSLGDFAAALDSGGLPSVDASKVRAISLHNYDEWGRDYRDQTLKIDQTNGISGLTDAQILALPALTTDYFYDNRDNLVAEADPGGTFTKHSYDGAGRDTLDSVTDGGVLGLGLATAKTLGYANQTLYDVVLEQTAYTYDNNGNVTQTLLRQRFDSDPTTATGNLAGPSGGSWASRDYYTETYYDAADRVTKSLDAGTHGFTGTASSGSSSTLTDSNLSSTGSYTNWTLRILAGADAGKTATVTGYNSSTHTLSFSPSFASPIDSTSVYAITDTGSLSTTYGYAADAIQTVSVNGSPTGGTFTLSFGGQTTGPIAYNAPANVQSALALLTSINSGNVAVTGAAGGPYAVRFMGSLGGQPQALMTASGSGLTGGTNMSVTLVMTTPGGDAGRTQAVTDPRSTVTKNDYDLLARTVTSINAFSTGVPASATDQTTRYAYDGNDDVVLMTAQQPGTTPAQSTAYVYGVGGTAGTNLFSNDLLARIEYPDKTTGAASTAAANDQSYAYNFLGDTTSFTDQNGTLHTYNDDVLGRLTADIVTTVGTGVDGTIRRLGYSFDTAGRPYQQTSYTNTAGTTTANQVQDAYNGLGQLITEYQNHLGAVNVSTTPKVQYAYTETSSGTENDSRLTSLTYPNGRKLDYVYNSGLDSTISRVSSLNDDAGTYAGHALEAYTYLGLSTIVQRTRDNGIDLSYLQQTGDTLSSTDGGDKYTGLDRFGRVIDQFWVNGSGSAIDRFQYGYDPDGNVLYKNNLVSSSNSELYHANGSSNGYDLLNRLTNFQRGTLNSTHDTISTPSRTLSYSLDAVGNQTAVSGSLSNTRTFNPQNQITAQTGLTVTPVYDNNGNMTKDEKNQTYKYDAWNRQVAAVGTTEVFAYDADGRRPSLTICGPTVTDSYYSADWQLLQEGTCGGTTATSQYVWGLGYVDDLVLRDDNSTTGSLGKTSSGLGRRLFAQQDADYNVTTLTTTTGTVQVRIQYDPYGMPTFLTAAWGTGGSLPTGWEPLFQGLRYDSTAKTYDGRNRIYDPALGVWMQDDPLGYVNGANRYQVELSDPTAWLDPLGLVRIKLGGDDWDLKVGGDFDHVHTVTDKEAKALGLPKGTRDLGPHLHGPNGQKFFPRSGVIMDRSGKKQKAPKNFMKEWECQQPRVNRALAKAGIRGLIILLALAANELSGENQELMNEIRGLLKKMESAKGAERDLAAAVLANDVQKIFSNDLAGENLIPDLFAPGAQDQLQQQFDSLDLTPPPKQSIDFFPPGTLW